MIPRGRRRPLHYDPLLKGYAYQDQLGEWQTVTLAGGGGGGVTAGRAIRNKVSHLDRSASNRKDSGAVGKDGRASDRYETAGAVNVTISRNSRAH